MSITTAKKNPPENPGEDQVYKPGSVLTAIYLAPELLLGSSHLLGTTGPVMRPSHGVAPDRVYSIPMSPWDGCALTAPFHSYLPKGRRHISVALVLRSPSAGVTRYPCPVEPGLSSQGAFRPSCAAVRSGRSAILPQENKIVKGFSQQLKTFPKSVILIASYVETRNGP